MVNSEVVKTNEIDDIEFINIQSKNNAAIEENTFINGNQDINMCTILGIHIAATNMAETIDFIKKNFKQLYGRYICISNVHTTVMGYDDVEYRKILNGSVLSLPDGKPLSVICKRRGNDRVDRVTGPDLMGELFKLSINGEEPNKKSYSHFFYGSTNETLAKLKVKLQRDYPKIKISGAYSPPFRPLTESEDIAIINLINKAKADFIWVGLGAPKQETWMYNHQFRIHGLMIGVGAGFDYYAGNIKRAPNWMQNLCLEWIYRLIQEPKKLWKRYVVTNSKFLWLIMRGK